MLDLFGFIAYSFVLLGMYLIAKKKRVGWIIKLIGDLGWVGIGLIMSPMMFSIVFVEVGFSIVDVIGYRNHAN